MSTADAGSPAPFTPGILDLRAALPALVVPDALAAPAACRLLPLSWLLLADRLATLYAMVFPERPEWLDDEVVDWQDEAALTAAAVRFLERVNEHRFPVYTDFWEAEVETVEWRLYEIPLILMGFDEWYEDWDDLAEPLPYLLHLSYSRDDEQGDGHARRYPGRGLPAALRPGDLAAELRQADLPEPLDALPDLIEMAHHATGNPWLDVGEMGLADSGGCPPWRPDEVAWLTEQWQAAEPVADRVYALLHWRSGTQADIDDKITAVHAALLAAYARAQAATADAGGE